MLENWTALWITLIILIICSIIIVILQVYLLRNISKQSLSSSLEKRIENRIEDAAHSLSIQLRQSIIELMHHQTDTETQKRLEEQFYIQRYMQAVGSYIALNTEENKETYYSMAADIYSHTPQKHWITIENIDRAIRSNNYELAQELLKELSRALAET